MSMVASRPRKLSPIAYRLSPISPLSAPVPQLKKPIRVIQRQPFSLVTTAIVELSNYNIYIITCQWYHYKVYSSPDDK